MFQLLVGTCCFLFRGETVENRAKVGTGQLGYVGMRTCVGMYVCVHVCMRMCLCMSVYEYVYMRMCVCVSMYVCVCLCV